LIRAATAASKSKRGNNTTSQGPLRYQGDDILNKPFTRIIRTILLCSALLLCSAGPQIFHHSIEYDETVTQLVVNGNPSPVWPEQVVTVGQSFISLSSGALAGLAIPTNYLANARCSLSVPTYWKN